MKKIISLLLILTLSFGVAVLAACGGSTSPKEGTVTRLTIDINPSIELMVDDQNKVIAVTALNDDGAVLISGESFIGKTPEEAVELAVSVAADTGYLVSGEVTADENTVKISVSGNDAYAKELASKIESKAKRVMDDLDLKGKIERADALRREGLVALAAANSLYTEEELSEMSDEELYSIIALARCEMAELASEEMRQMYMTAKEYDISFARSEQMARIMDALGAAYAVDKMMYENLLAVHKTSIAALEEARYKALLDPDSPYQKALTALRDSKEELIKQRTYTASLDVNGEEYASATVQLELAEESYEAALAAFEALGKSAEDAFEGAISAIKISEGNLLSMEKKLLSDEEFRAALEAGADDLERELNEKKDSFFESFESEYSDDLKAMKETYAAKKAALLEQSGKR